MAESETSSSTAEPVQAIALPNLPTTVVRPSSPKKRRRSEEGASRGAQTEAPNLRAVAAPISPKAAVVASNHPTQLTGLSALVDEQRAREEEERRLGRQSSPNPGQEVIASLLGASSPVMSRIQEGLPKGAAKDNDSYANAIKIIRSQHDEHGPANTRTSPVSSVSVATAETITAGAMEGNGIQVGSPSRMEEEAANDGGDYPPDDSQMEGEATTPDMSQSNKAMTYPGPLSGVQSSDAKRGMSLPGSGLIHESPRSPSAKKHKCPYCSTDFTRHHNLKSHLLTHSHEKPYFCETCESRFRRLHDLKRHTKLHTGERPHVCPKCDRSFARGDALARHTKGQGGCAGRRSSMGDFGGDGGDDRSQGPSMHGLIYTGETSQEPGSMDDDPTMGGRSLPSIRNNDPGGDAHRQSSGDTNPFQPRHPSTYPPPPARQAGSSTLQPPTGAFRGSPNMATNSPSQASPNQFSSGVGATSAFQGAAPNVFGQPGMTESPKPLSPGSHQLGHPEPGITRNRSPSLSQQLGQQQINRRMSAQNQIGLPPPVSGSGHPGNPQLPSLPGLNPPEPRFTLHSQAPGQSLTGVTSPSFPSQPPSQNTSLSSHGTAAQPGSGDGSSVAPNNDRVWAYIHSLEAKVNRLQDEVTALRAHKSSTEAPTS